MSNEPRTASREREMRVQNGWVMLFPVVAALVLGTAAMPLGAINAMPALIVVGIVLVSLQGHRAH
jgi:hypothetical protein